MRSPRRLLVPTVLAAALVSGCTEPSETPGRSAPSPTDTAGSTGSPSATGAPYVGYPDAVVVLGHSGSTGENSDPDRPGYEVRANSWATGTNPDVDSVYQRLLAVHPAAEGQVHALSQAGARVVQLVLQAGEAVAMQPPDPLVLVQIMDNDMVCPLNTAALEVFEEGVREALGVLDAGLPTSRVFVVSKFGSPRTWWTALAPEQRRSTGRTGPCEFVGPDGELVPRELRRVEDLVAAYEDVLESVCAEVERCAYDGGAFGRTVDKAPYVASDLTHLSVRGHAAAAAVAWRALRRAGLVPADG